MTKNGSLSGPARLALSLLACSLALVFGACDNDVHVRPTEPWFPGFAALGQRSVQINGSLQAENGSIAAATILYDGLELPGARVRCSSPNGCAELRLAATTPTAVGAHTVSFKVLEQTAEVVDYRAQGYLLVNRAGSTFGGVTLPLGPTPATLRSGESVDFAIEFSDDW